MSIFDQRGQNVNYQYNAAGDINIGGVQNQAGLIKELSKLGAEMEKAMSAGAIDEDIAVDAEYQLKKAIQHAKEPAADKGKIIEHLNEAKALIEGVASAAGLVTALVKAVEMVQKFF